LRSAHLSITSFYLDVRASPYTYRVLHKSRLQAVGFHNPRSLLLSSRSVHLGISSFYLDVRASPYTYRVLHKSRLQAVGFHNPRSLLLSSRSAQCGITSFYLDVRASPYTYRVLRNPACKQSVCVIHDSCCFLLALLMPTFIIS